MIHTVPYGELKSITNYSRDWVIMKLEFRLPFGTNIEQVRKLIKKIDATMELIDQDDYGYCEACGVEIGIQRLEARPTATQCIDCKTLAEIKEKQELG